MGKYTVRCKDCGERKEASEFTKVFSSGAEGHCKSCVVKNFPTERVCNKCGKTKSIEEFGVYKRDLYGHNKVCKVCAKHKMDLYYINNAEKSKETYKRYNESHKSEKAAADKLYREANKERIAKQRKQYREANKSKIFLAKKKYREENKEKIASKKKLYYASAAGKVTARRYGKQRAINIQSTRDGSVTKQSIADLYFEQDAKCYICGCDLNELENRQIHLDHVYPLALGGTHTIENLSWSCAKCNLEKGIKINE